MKKKLKNKLTFTNIIVILAIIIYLLNLFAFSPDTGPIAINVKEQFKSKGQELTSFAITLAKIMGIWGGNLNAYLGFQIDKFLHGEIWRLYTVVLTHGHIAHIIMNLIALFIAGNHIEKEYGTKKTITYFLILTALNNIITSIIYNNILGQEHRIVYGSSIWITCLLGMILIKSILKKNYYKKEFKGKERFYLILYFISTTFFLDPNVFTMIIHLTGLVEGIVFILILEKGFNKK